MGEWSVVGISVNFINLLFIGSARIMECVPQLHSQCHKMHVSKKENTQFGLLFL